MPLPAVRVVIEQLGDAVVHAGADRAVCWQQNAVVDLPHQQQRAEVIRQRSGSRVGLEADRRSDGGQDVVAGEEQPRRRVVEDEVVVCMPGTGDRLQRPVGECKFGPAG